MVSRPVRLDHELAPVDGYHPNLQLPGQQLRHPQSMDALLRPYTLKSTSAAEKSNHKVTCGARTPSTEEPILGESMRGLDSVTAKAYPDAHGMPSESPLRSFFSSMSVEWGDPIMFCLDVCDYVYKPVLR